MALMRRWDIVLIKLYTGCVLRSQLSMWPKKKEWEEGGRKKKKRSWGAKYEAFKLWEEAYGMTGAKEPSNHQPVPDRNWFKNGADVDQEQGKCACNRVPFEFKNQLRERATWSLV